MQGDRAVEDQVIALAKDTVIGVVTAREVGSCDDAQLLIDAYLIDAARLGVCPGTAWALLFSAATLWVSALIDIYAKNHDEEPIASIQMFAAAHAAGESRA